MAIFNSYVKLPEGIPSAQPQNTSGRVEALLRAGRECAKAGDEVGTWGMKMKRMSSEKIRLQRY